MVDSDDVSYQRVVNAMAQKLGNGDFCGNIPDSFLAASNPSSSLAATDFYQSEYALEEVSGEDQSLMKFSANSVTPAAENMSSALGSTVDCKNEPLQTTDDLLSDLISSHGEELVSFISSTDSTKCSYSGQPLDTVDAHNHNSSRTVSSTANDQLILPETCEFSGSQNGLDYVASQDDVDNLQSASDQSSSYLTDENVQNLPSADGNFTVDSSANKCMSSIVGTVVAAAASGSCDKPVGDIIIAESGTAVERRRMDRMVLDLPLEVIGACWFMRRETETCLQAVTANDEKIVIRLNKKGSRVNVAFEASSDSSSAFEEIENGCLCHVETLLEPARRAIASRASTATESTPMSTRSPSKRRRETIESARVSASTVPTDATITSNPDVHVSDITSRLRVRLKRLSGGVKYDDEEVEDGDEEGQDEDGVEADGNLGKSEDDENDGIDDEDEDFDSCEDTDVYEEDNDDFDEEDEDDEEAEMEPVVKTPVQPKCIKIQPARRGRKARSSHMSSDDDDLWTPKHRTPKTRSKIPSRAPIKLKVKIKEEPVLCVEQDIFNEDTEEEENGCASDFEPGELKKKRSHRKKKPVEMSEAELEKPKRSHHKKKLSDEADEVKYKLRKWRVKEGPKWEKKGNCPYCGVFYGNLSQHVGLYCPKNPDRQRAYHCCYCKFRSLDRASLIEHKTTHVLARDFKCEICDSAFFTRQRLVRHMRYVHLLGSNPVRIYTCDRCGKRFRYHSHYDRHLTIHSEEKSAQCDQCGKFFKNSHNVRNHQSRMHPGKPEPFPYYCEKCGQGAHSMSAHRCITPGEMHGSRRRRAPRNSMLHTSTALLAAAAADAADADVSETAAACSDEQDVLSSPPITDHCSLTTQRHDQPPAADASSQHQQPVAAVDSRIASPQVVDCRSTATSLHGVEGRPPPGITGVTAASMDSCTTPPASQLLNHRSAPNSSDRRSSAGSTPGSSAQISERPGCAVPSTTISPAFDRHGMPFDAHLIGRSSYHHMHQTEPPFDRRGAPSFEHHLPAMAHQPQQQPPYSNLFAVDPLLQLRAANMMYRMDY